VARIALVVRPTGIELQVGAGASQIEPLVVEEVLHEEQSLQVGIGVAAEPSPPFGRDEPLSIPYPERLGVKSEEFRDDADGIEPWTGHHRPPVVVGTIPCLLCLVNTL
jgi:hypothetical protein